MKRRWERMRFQGGTEIRGRETKDYVWKLCNRVWSGTDWIEEWNDGMIAPIMKKGEGERVEDYKG